MCSGRSNIILKDFAYQLDMDKYCGYLICVNGLSLYTCKDGSIFYLQKISMNDAKILYNNFKNKNVEMMGVNDDYIYEYVLYDYLQEKIRYKKENNINDDQLITGDPKGIIYDQ